MNETRSPTDPPPSPSPPPPPPPLPTVRPAAPALPWKRLALGWFGYLLTVAASIALLVGAVAWLLGTASGTAWLLWALPQVEVDDPRGALLGDFEARQVRIPLPGEGARLRIDGLRWRGLSFAAAQGTAWLRIGMGELGATRVQITLSSEPARDTPVPSSLALPFELHVAALRIGELSVDGLDTPLRDLRAGLVLGARDGAEHRVDAAQGAWGRLRFEGQASVATTGDLGTQARLDLHQPFDSGGDWAATATLDGPLASPHLAVRLRARATATQPAQSLDASAVLRPFAAWPLGELQAEAGALDLSALHGDAPRTALDLELKAVTTAADRPATLTASLANHAAGRFSEGRLPLRRLTLDAAARPDDPQHVELRRFEAEAGTAQLAGGRLQGSGRWSPDEWQLALQLEALRPSALDARAPEMSLGGGLQLEGRGFAGTAPGAAQVDVRGELRGTLPTAAPGRAVAPPVQLTLDARIGELRIELRQALARAGQAQATLSGTAQRPNPQGAWSVRGQSRLTEFDPALWWPGPTDSPWRAGPHRLNAHADFDLRLPAGAAPATWQSWLAGMRGQAQLALDQSQLAGVALGGNVALQTTAEGTTRLQANIDADGNRLRLEGRVGAGRDGADDLWQATVEAPAVDRLQPVLRLWQGADARFGGALKAEARVAGRWPQVVADGRFDAVGLRAGTFGLQRGQGQWRLGSRDGDAFEARIDLGPANVGRASVESLQLRLQGTVADHRLTLDAQSRALPPAWVESVRAAPSGALATRTLARVQLEGGFITARDQPFAGWRGRLREAEMRGNAAGAPSWAALHDAAFEGRWDDGPARLHAAAGQAELLGAVLRWSRIDWSAAEPGRAPARLDAQMQLEALAIGPLLARAQPGFGWGGDLRVEGQVSVRSAPTVAVDAVLQRVGGDLTVTDDAGTRSLGLSDLRLGVNAADGVWSFSAGLAGQTLGQAAGAVVARTSPTAPWPTPDAPLDGVLELRVADLGVWGRWLPPGWRLRGEMRVGAAIGGRFGAPEYTGELSAHAVEVRNPLQGVDVRDGEVAMVLQGETARIERFSARAGNGTLELKGGANFGAQPRAELGLELDRFQLLGRVDRRVVGSGQARLKLGLDSVALDGDLRIDEGLIDFSRSEAPTLAEDITIRRSAGAEAELTPVASAEEAAARTAARSVALNLRVDMGEKLRVRGRGLDTGLRGELRFTAPQGRLRVDGTLRTVGGTYNAYRQRLTIDRGILTFNGPIDNPQLDIEATRPNLDVRVGVAVTGTVLVPRIRLFSEPDMSDVEKLSWLLRGRAPEGNEGGADTALLQAAAMALASGEEPSAADELLRLIGLDDLSLRQGDGTSHGAILSVGKQLSRNWFVGYERSLNAATGTFYIIYRVAQRFTVRAKSGEQNSLELIWTWRWN